jgi:hypothetical protein
LGSNEDNLKILAAKGFVKVLNEDLISYITDWSEHNLIRADRKIDSVYKHLLLKIVPEADLLEPKPRADTGKTTGGRPLDGIGKDRIGEYRKVEERNTPSKKAKHHYMTFVTLSTDEYFKLKDKFGGAGVRERCEALNLWKGSKGKKTASDYMTILNWERMNKKDKDGTMSTPIKTSSEVMEEYRRKEVASREQFYREHPDLNAKRNANINREES